MEGGGERSGALAGDGAPNALGLVAAEEEEDEEEDEEELLLLEELSKADKGMASGARSGTGERENTGEASGKGDF